MKPEADGSFLTALGNYTVPRCSVFGREILTNWKPFVFATSELLRHRLYLCVFREKGGNWYFVMRCFSQQHRTIRYQLEVFPASGLQGQTHRFEDWPVSSCLSNAQVLDSGRFLRLNDAQVRVLVQEPKLLDIRVKFVLEPLPPIPDEVPAPPDG